MNINIDVVEGLCLTNYTAISILERLGISPSQEQVTLMESVLLMATYPNKVKPETIKYCVGEDSLAYLFLHLRNKDLRG
jgi:hypothetical protein